MVEIAGQPVPDTELVEMVGGKYTAEILSVTREPRSAKGISEMLDIPIATSYRRIEALTELGLLEFEERVLTDERMRRDTYRRTVNEIDIVFGDNEFTLSVEEAVTVENKLEGIWRDLASSGSSDG